MKILWSSNAPHVGSGYGVQTNHVVEGLRRLGHDVALAPNFGVQGGAIEMGGMRVYPIWRDKVGQDVLAAHAKHFGADLVVSLYDIWPYGPEFAAGLHKPWAPWIPQDSLVPCPTVTERARQADYPIAMSQFGLKTFADQGIECQYIPHGCSVDVYRPLDKSACRKELGLPETFIVLMVAANQSFPSRKSFPESLLAFKAFHQENPDSLLYLHTTRKPRGQAWDGVELDLLVRALGLEKAVRFAEEYSLVLGLPDTEMAKVYNAADVLLSPSMGEGFGVPIIEAQSCGLPVITTDCSSMSELTFNGIAVKPLQPAWTALNTWMAVPSVEGVTQALKDMHEQNEFERRRNSTEGRKRIVESYSWPVVMDRWRAFLSAIESGAQPSFERTYQYQINGIDLQVTDDKLSFTADCVAGEILKDSYGLEKIDFQPGDKVLDIGAHTGLFAMYVAQRWPGVQVFSYEPSPTNFARLEKNIKGIKNIRAFNLGVTKDARTIQLALGRGNTGGTSEFTKPNGHLREIASTVTLNSIVKDLGRVKLLKIDCEGGEHEILTTATCLDQIEYISGEFHINSYLAEQGYSIPGLVQHCNQFLAPSRVTYTSCVMSE